MTIIEEGNIFRRELANRAVIYCEEYERETGDRLLMRPYKCGVICCCCDIFGASKVTGHLSGASWKFGEKNYWSSGFDYLYKNICVNIP